MSYILLPGMIIGVIAQVYRYRRVSDSVSRQQVKWVVFALVWMTASAIAGGIVGESVVVPGRSTVLYSLIGIPLFFVVPGLLVPVAIAFSILRYRLWDIPIFVNRALVYGALTATLAGTYIGIVIGLQAVFRAVSDQNSGVAIAHLHPGNRRALPAGEAAHPGLHRPPLVPAEVRRGTDPRRLRCHGAR